MVRSLDLKLTTGLRKELGLESGVHLWPHLLRSLRASQLNEDYSLDLDALLAYYSWESVATARRYARKSWRSLATAMMAKNPTYEGVLLCGVSPQSLL